MVSIPGHRLLIRWSFGHRLVALLVATLILGAAGSNVHALTIVNFIPVGNYPSWVAIDSSNNRLYVTNYEGSSVSVVDPTTNQVVATIPVGNNPRTIAIDPNLSRGYVTNAGSGTLSVIDLGTNTFIKDISFPEVSTPVPWHATVNPALEKVYVTLNQPGGQPGDVAVIDETTDEIVDDLPTGNAPLDVVVNPQNNRLYVGVGNPTSVYVFDGNTDAQLAIILTGDLNALPDRMALNSTTNRLYVSIQLSNNHISVIDTSANKLIANVSVPGVPDGISVDSNSNLVYIGDLTQPYWLWVMNGQTNAITACLIPGPQPLAVTADPAASVVYTANAGNNSVSVINNSLPSTCQTYIPLFSN
jgi:YVTN family beta-propeller protein